MKLFIQFMHQLYFLFFQSLHSHVVGEGHTLHLVVFAFQVFEGSGVLPHQAIFGEQLLLKSVFLLGHLLSLHIHISLNVVYLVSQVRILLL